jgi:hypothetical protein
MWELSAAKPRNARAKAVLLVGQFGEEVLLAAGGSANWNAGKWTVRRRPTRSEATPRRGAEKSMDVDHQPKTEVA